MKQLTIITLTFVFGVWLGGWYQTRTANDFIDKSTFLTYYYVDPPQMADSDNNVLIGEITRGYCFINNPNGILQSI